MGNIVSKVLQDQYLKLCSLKVDADKQSQLLQQLLQNLRRTEQKLASELIPDPKRLSFYDQRVLESCGEESNQKLVKDIGAIGEFPRIKLAADIIDYAFQQVSRNPKTPDLLKLIIMSLKPSLFRLALEDYRTLVAESNPILETIDILTSYVPLWKDEKKANYPTFKKLVSILDFVETSSDQLNKKLKDTVQPIAQIRENQQKRSLIFEKRLVEREASVAITKTSQLFIEEILTQIKQRYSIQPFLSDFLEQHWSRLLILEYVRHDYVAFIGSLKLFVRLINSLEEITSKEQLNHLIDELPELKAGLLAGLTKLAVSELEANEFLTKIETQHLHIIQQNSHLSTEESIADNPTQDSEPLFEDQEPEIPSIDEDDLIRLKPTDFYSEDVSANSITNNENDISEASVDDVAAKDTTINTGLDSELVSKSFLEVIEEVIQLESHSVEKLQLTDQDLFTKMQGELSQLVFPNQLAYDSDEVKSYISLNHWYSFYDDNELHKLIYIDRTTQEHIFSNQMAQKSHAFKIEEINQLYSKHKINKFSALNIVAPAIKKSLQIYREFLTERKKAKNDQDSAVVIDISPQEQTNLSKPGSQTINSTIDTTSPKGSNLDRENTASISDITVGSWINYNLNNRQIKCKLAARIISKDVYIFVDRKGLKILEQCTQELVEKLDNGKVEIVESEKSSSLESVIEKTRNLKS